MNSSQGLSCQPTGINKEIFIQEIKPPQKKDIEEDLKLLDNKNDLNDISIVKTQELISKKRIYKFFKTSNEEEKQLYHSFKSKLIELCRFKLPFRVLEIVKNKIKLGEFLPLKLIDKIKTPKSSASKEEKREYVNQLRNTLISQISSHEEALKILERIQWGHGTNSAILPMIPHNDYTMVGTGKLLERGIAPMCGDLTIGIGNNGINQKWISVETVRDLDRSWEWAVNMTNSFDPQCLEKEENFFVNVLDKIDKIYPTDHSWDIHIISLLKFKQWDPTTFKELRKKHSEKIEKILKSITNRLFPNEAMVLEFLQCPIEELRNQEEMKKKYRFLDTTHRDWVWEFSEYKHPASDIFDGLENYDCFEHSAVYLATDILHLRLFPNCNGLGRRDKHEENLRKSQLGDYLIKSSDYKYEDRFLVCDYVDVDRFLQKFVKEKIEHRIQSKTFLSKEKLLKLKRVFEEEPKIQLTKDQKEMIASPFPILLASTKTKGFFLVGTQEANIPSAKWGDEMDVIFVKKEDQNKVATWLIEHKLEKKITLHSIDLIEPLFSATLYHAPNQVIGEEHRLTSKDYEFIRKNIQKCLHLYRAPYPNNQERKSHGVPHAIRTSFFAVVLTEMFLAQGYTLKVDPKLLPIAAFLHDSAREDDGVDLWDKESGEICKNFMEKELDLEDNYSQLLATSIADKDHEHPNFLELKIIHDSDCIEFVRCLKDDGNFERERLWLFKDQFQEPLLDLFINEAKLFIQLTETPIIKEFINNSSDPFSILVHITRFSNSFPFLNASTHDLIDVHSSSELVLPQELQKAISAYLMERGGK